jgi:DNA-binding transcriptional ArsR family regulator
MDIFEAIANETRRKIIKILGEKGKAGFSDLMNELGLDSPSLAFHIRKLGNLITKVNDEYTLTEEGKKAYKIIMEVEGRKGESVLEREEENSPQQEITPTQSSNVIEVRDLGFYEITPELVKSLKSSKSKLRIVKVGILKIDDPVNPEDLKDVIDEINEVGIIDCSPKCSIAIAPKLSKVGLIGQSFAKALQESLKFPFHIYTTHNKKFTVFDSSIQPPKSCEIEVDGSDLTIVQGEPHLKVECLSLDDVEINLGEKMSLEINGCEAVLSLPNLEKLDVEINGGDVNLSLNVKEVEIDADGSDANINITGCEKAEINADASSIKGKINFPSGGILDIDNNASTIRLTLDLPENVGIINDVRSNISHVELPPIRQGEKKLKIDADVNAGELIIKT